MDSVRLEISQKDWIYIVIVGALFGFLNSIFFYFLNVELQKISTIVFSTLTAINIALFSFLLITFSNDYVLPRVNEKFWYFFSFIFSFLSGFLGFLLSFFVGNLFEIAIVNYLSNYWFYISITIGFLTFLIGLILHQFVSMKHRNEHINSEVLETKIKALENELNPHFLFNALNSISELIYIDKQKAEKATLDLSKFLRNAIGKESLVTIKNEMEMVQTYLQIENIRFEDHIELEVNLKEQDELILVPKFSVQLLVENAIKHGFNKEKLNVKIDIDSNKISVSNNGKITHEVNYGTGLSNLKRRLELLGIGKLKHETNESFMRFIIELEEK